MTPVRDYAFQNRSGSMDRSRISNDLADIRERTLDKTIEDSFPASDPPSTDPAPEADSFTA